MKKILILATALAISFNSFAEETKITEKIELTYLELPKSEFANKHSDNVKAEVFYFFSYGCKYCYLFSPYLDIYLKNIDKEKVSFYYKPLEMQEAWKEYAKAHYIADSLNINVYENIFENIHKNEKKMFSKNQLGDFFMEEHNVKYSDFNNAYNSYLNKYKIDKNEKLADKFNVTETPTIVIIDSNNNVYKLSPSVNGDLYNMIASTVIITDKILK